MSITAELVLLHSLFVHEVRSGATTPRMVRVVTSQLQLLDQASRDDLRVFLERLGRVGQSEVRIVTRGSVLAVFGCTQAPAGLLDTVPVVLVLRSISLAPQEASQRGSRAGVPAGAVPTGAVSAGAVPAGAVSEDGLDVTVSGRALLDRIARMASDELLLDVPDTVVTASWAGVLPPVTGWEAAGVVDATSLATVAAEGIERVASVLPDNPGDALVRKVRAEVWGNEIAPGLPASVAFAAETMGFLRGESHARLAKTLTWTMVSTSRGQVLVRSLLG